MFNLGQADVVLIHVDGDISDTLAFPFSLLIDKNEFTNGNGRKHVPRSRVKFVFEATDDLGRISALLKVRGKSANSLENCKKKSTKF